MSVYSSTLFILLSLFRRAFCAARTFGDSSTDARWMNYDDAIVRQMIERVKVRKGGKLTVIFGAGYEIEEQVWLENAILLSFGISVPFFIRRSRILQNGENKRFPCMQLVHWQPLCGIFFLPLSSTSIASAYGTAGKYGILIMFPCIL